MYEQNVDVMLTPSKTVRNVSGTEITPGMSVAVTNATITCSVFRTGWSEYHNSYGREHKNIRANLLITTNKGGKTCKTGHNAL